MLQAELHFPNMSKHLVVATMMDLPRQIRPHTLSGDETKEGTRASSADALMQEADRCQGGFFLRSPSILYDLDIAPARPLVLNCFFNSHGDLAKDLLLIMSKANPLFGFACLSQEQEHWNRLYNRQGPNAIESWVGRDPTNYVPGLYWLTLLPEALLARHDVPFAPIAEAALEHVDVGTAQHVVRFYDRPEDWRTRSDMTAVRSLPGIFDIEVVKPLAAATQSISDLARVTMAWP